VISCGSSTLGRQALVMVSNRTPARTKATEKGGQNQHGCKWGTEDETERERERERERGGGTLPCTAPGEVASEGETNREWPQREHRTRTDTHRPGSGTPRGPWEPAPSQSLYWAGHGPESSSQRQIPRSPGVN
jgi:hypothetical protein